MSLLNRFDLVGNDSPVEDVFSYRYALFPSKNTTFEWFWTGPSPLHCVEINKYNRSHNEPFYIASAIYGEMPSVGWNI